MSFLLQEELNLLNMLSNHSFPCHSLLAHFLNYYSGNCVPKWVHSDAQQSNCPKFHFCCDDVNKKCVKIKFKNVIQGKYEISNLLCRGDHTIHGKDGSQQNLVLAAHDALFQSIVW